MADSQERGPAAKAGPMAYGMAPVMASGVLGVVLLGGLAFGGITMGQQMMEGPRLPAASSTTEPGEPGQSGDPSDPSNPGTPGDPKDPSDPGTSGDPSDPTNPATPGDPNDPSDPSDPSDPKDPGDPTAPGDDGSNTNPTQPPGHPGDPGDWEYNAQGDVIHTVQWGDTLSSISKQYGVSVDQLAWYNGIEDPNLIYADSVLRVPFLAIPGPEVERMMGEGGK